MVSRVLKTMLRNSIKAYMDDIVVKNVDHPEHFVDLCKVFERLKKFWVRHNPSKWIFNVRSGMFLGHVMGRRDIEASSNQSQTILNLPKPRNKEIQILTGKIATVPRFISSMTDKCKSFFPSRMCKKKKKKKLIGEPSNLRHFSSSKNI